MALKKEVEALRRNEEELTTRLAAVEAELASTRNSKTDSVAQIAELKRSVQVGCWRVMTWLAEPFAPLQWRLFKM